MPVLVPFSVAFLGVYSLCQRTIVHPLFSFAVVSSVPFRHFLSFLVLREGCCITVCFPFLIFSRFRLCVRDDELPSRRSLRSRFVQENTSATVSALASLALRAGEHKRVPHARRGSEVGRERDSGPARGKLLRRDWGRRAGLPPSRAQGRAGEGARLRGRGVGGFRAVPGSVPYCSHPSRRLRSWGGLGGHLWPRVGGWGSPPIFHYSCLFRVPFPFILLMFVCVFLATSFLAQSFFPSLLACISCTSVHLCGLFHCVLHCPFIFFVPAYIFHTCLCFSFSCCFSFSVLREG